MIHNKNATARVSVIIPCFNARQYLADALESSLTQTWRQLDIIVIDDGSVDGSFELARQYESRGVRVFRQHNRGAAAARNVGLTAARGEFIQFLDADDLLAPDKIERQLSDPGAQGSNVLLSCPWVRFSGEPSQGVFNPQPNWRNLTGVEFLQLHYEEGCMMHPAAWLVPRAIIDCAGKWDESLSLNDDGEYFARIMLTADQIVFCPTACSYYRSGLPSSLSGRKDRPSLESLYKSVCLTIDHLLSKDSSPRSIAAAAHGWKWTAFELYPGAPDLARYAEENCMKLGGSDRAFPAGNRFRIASKFLGWRLAKRLFI